MAIELRIQTSSGPRSDWLLFTLRAGWIPQEDRECIEAASKQPHGQPQKAFCALMINFIIILCQGAFDAFVLTKFLVEHKAIVEFR